MFLSASVMTEEIQGFEIVKEMKVSPISDFAVISLSEVCCTHFGPGGGYLTGRF